MTQEFNEWWNSDRLTQTNQYEEDTPVYWAWEGYSSRDADITKLREQVTLLRKLLTRYRNETPIGNQPHMICHEVDEALSPTEPKP